MSTQSVTLSEAASKELLRRHGVPFAPEVVAHSVDDAVAAARTVGLPAVLKLNGDGIAHKTERGLVRLGLATEDAVATAAAELLAAATPEDGPVSLLVAPMLRGTRELIAGLLTDPQFGPVVMLGVGGVLAEALGDVAFRLVPFDLAEARSLLDDLRTQAILGPFRGEPAVDRDAVASVLVALAEVAGSEPTVVSVDLNPLIIVDGRPIAVDALVETTGARA
ncbi:MAG: acetate--CoA ligase family protein [Actinomycetes bacterium]